MHVARGVVHAVVGLMLVLIARVIVIVFVVEFPQPVFCIWRYTLYRCCGLAMPFMLVRVLTEIEFTI